VVVLRLELYTPVGSTPSFNDTLDFVTIASTGNATDFGNLACNVFKLGGVSNATRMVMAGRRGT
jgi:hypothetical protein